MITLDSPVATVLGDQKKKRDANVEQLHEGEMLTVSGQLGRPDIRTYKDKRTGRPAYRVDTVVHTDGPRLRMSFFAKSKGVAEWNTTRLKEGRRGIFLGKVGRFRD